MKTVLLGLRLLQPLLLMALAVVLIPLMLGAAVPVLAIAWIVGLFLMMGLRAFREFLGVTWLGYVLWGVLLPVVAVSASVPTLAAVFAAVLHFPGLEFQELQLPAAELKAMLPELALLAAAAGIIGVSSTLVFALVDMPWRLKQLRQVRTLPRSRARSAAVGLAEFEGIARAVNGGRDISPPKARTARPFYLEDATGRILVDPGEAAVRPSSVAGDSMKLNEIEEGIRDGDRVYVIGNVQVRDHVAPGALESELLVVRPLRQNLTASPVARLLFRERRQPGDRDAPNIFIVDKGGEHNVTRRLGLVLWDYCAYLAVYLGASFWLVQAAWPWLAPAAYYRALLAAAGVPPG